PPIPQSLDYHQFADARTLIGVPNFFNVASNFPFLLVGVIGIGFLLKKEGRESFLDSRERWAYAIFFAGVAFTSIGSSYYHLAPDNDRLFWDRLPMTLGFMSVFAAVISERVSLKAGRRLLAPLLAIGLASVLYWRVTEAAGEGDLRLYAIVQFYPLLAIPAMLALFPPRYTRGGEFVASLAVYGAAKVFELIDAQIFSAGLFLSGHSLKHAVAALSALVILGMLRKRKPLALREAQSISTVRCEPL
ncbi:MAG: alkaline phytoceramidase, partial [Acidobacteriota bacterium]